jgi:transcription elongation factor S-II
MAAGRLDEIQARLKALISTGQYSANASDIISELVELDGIEMTNDLLTSSRIAATIGLLRTKPDNPEIKAIASNLFSKWTALRKSGTAPSIKASERTEAIRKKRRDVLYEELRQAAEQMPVKPLVDPKSVAVAIESSIFAHDDHDTRFGSLMTALTERVKVQELQFARRLLLGKMSPAEFGNLTTNDIMTSDQKRKVAEAKQEAFRRTAVPVRTVSSSAFFKCPECNSESVTSYQFQILSGDEPITNFCLCVTCGHEWRE